MQILTYTYIYVLTYVYIDAYMYVSPAMDHQLDTVIESVMRFLMLWFLLWDSKRPDPTRRIRRHFPVNRIYGVHLSIVCSNGSDWRMATGSGELFNYRSRLTGDNKESPNASRLQTTTVRTCSEKHIPPFF